MEINFLAEGRYLRPKGGTKALYAEALGYSKTLDEYNNGLLCDGT